MIVSKQNLSHIRVFLYNALRCTREYDHNTILTVLSHRKYSRVSAIFYIIEYGRIATELTRAKTLSHASKTIRTAIYILYSRALLRIRSFCRKRISTYYNVWHRPTPTHRDIELGITAILSPPKHDREIFKIFYF